MNEQDGDKQQALQDLYKAFMCLKTEQECAAFLHDLCTPREIHEMAERWVIARMLNRGGKSYRDISGETGASTTTVGRVARYLQHEPWQGYRLVLARWAADGK